MTRIGGKGALRRPVILVLGIIAMAGSILTGTSIFKRGASDLIPRTNPVANAQILKPIPEKSLIHVPLVMTLNHSASVIAEFKEIRTTVLKSAEQERVYHQLLSSRENLQDILNVLQKIPTEFSEQDLSTRLDSVQFLDEALSWAGNPQSPWLTQEVEKVLAREIEDLNIPLGAKELLGGDKIELFGLLASVDPDKAKHLLERTKSQKDHALFEYAKSMYELPL